MEQHQLWCFRNRIPAKGSLLDFGKEMQILQGLLKGWENLSKISQIQIYKHLVKFGNRVCNQKEGIMKNDYF